MNPARAGVNQTPLSMDETPDIVLRTILIGIGGSAAMDLWALFLRRAFGVPSLDYDLLGRWIGHLPCGRFTRALCVLGG
jgi:hypothetical protein